MFFTPAHVSYWVTISSVKQTALGSCAQVAQKEARQMPEGNQETRAGGSQGGHAERCLDSRTI